MAMLIRSRLASRLAARLHRLRRDKSGAAMIELALAAPLIVSVTFCGVEFGRAVTQYQAADNAARSAVRYLSRVPTSAFASSADWAWIAARKLALQGKTSAASTDPYMLPSTTTMTITMPSASTIQVVLNVPYTSSILTAFNFSAITFHIVHRERSIGI